MGESERERGVEEERDRYREWGRGERGGGREKGAGWIEAGVSVRGLTLHCCDGNARLNTGEVLRRQCKIEPG